MQYEILRGDCISQMRAMPDNSFDSIVCDPPYELGFMGKSWDASGIAYSVEMWAEALRVLKPGGHLLAFSGSRTYHRMTCAIEDAGFEVRDQIMWVFGSGFPKSLNVSKAIDKEAGAVREVISEGKAVKRMIPGADQNATGSWIKDNGREYVPTETTPATDAARQWEGWGTALKPAHEPICVARKPLTKGATVAANVLQHGTGALNIDGCRVGEPFVSAGGSNFDAWRTGEGREDRPAAHGADNAKTVSGRWPANLIHDGSDEVLALFPELKGAGAARTAEQASHSGSRAEGWGNMGAPAMRFGDSGSAARFFYCAKSSKSDRGPNNTHPTVKPLALMQYLCRLVTPPGGRILDPFAGSGSTIVAALREGFIATGIELLDDHADIIEGRVDHELYGDLL